MGDIDYYRIWAVVWSSTYLPTLAQAITVAPINRDSMWITPLRDFENHYQLQYNKRLGISSTMRFNLCPSHGNM